LFHFAEKHNTSVWLFRFGNAVFIVARFLSVIFAVLTFWFGLEPFASQVLRTVGLAFVCGLQSYLLFQFCIFQVKRLRAHTVVVTPPKSPKKVQKKPKDVSDLPEVDQNTRKQALKQKKVKWIGLNCYRHHNIFKLAQCKTFYLVKPAKFIVLLKLIITICKIRTCNCSAVVYYCQFVQFNSHFCNSFWFLWDQVNFCTGV